MCITVIKPALLLRNLEDQIEKEGGHLPQMPYPESTNGKFTKNLQYSSINPKNILENITYAYKLFSLHKPAFLHCVFVHPNRISQKTGCIMYALEKNLP